MDVREFFRNPISSVSDWLNAHKEFVAVHLTRALSVVFMLIAAYFLAKSLGML